MMDGEPTMNESPNAIAALEQRLAALEQALRRAQQQAAVLQAGLALSPQNPRASDLQATPTHIMCAAEK